MTNLPSESTEVVPHFFGYRQFGLSRVHSIFRRIGLDHEIWILDPCASLAYRTQSVVPWFSEIS